MEKETFLTSLKKYIHILGLYLNKKEDPSLEVDDKELSFFIKLSKHHSLMAFLYQALMNVKVQVNSTSLKKLEEYYLSNLRKAVLFNGERKALLLLISFF